MTICRSERVGPSLPRLSSGIGGFPRRSGLIPIIIIITYIIIILTVSVSLSLCLSVSVSLCFSPLLPLLPSASPSTSLSACPSQPSPPSPSRLPSSLLVPPVAPLPLSVRPPLGRASFHISLSFPSSARPPFLLALHPPTTRTPTLAHTRKSPSPPARAPPAA